MGATSAARTAWVTALMALPTLLLPGGLARAEAADVSLTVKPLLCITDKREESCALAIMVTWRSTEPGNFCLHNDLENAPLRCWTLANAGMLVDERSVRETFRYWITDGVSAGSLAEAALDVMTADSEDRRRQRPRRHVWNIL